MGMGFSFSMKMVSALLLLLAIVLVSSQELDDFLRPVFSKCDKDSSKALNRDEFSHCVLRHLNQDLNAGNTDFDIVRADDGDISKLFKLTDHNGDGKITLKEYGKMFAGLQSPGQANEPITVQTKDGETKTINQSDLFGKLREQMKGFRKENDQILREDEKTEKIADIEKDNPALAKFISIGQWALDKVKGMGHTDGRLHKMRSLSKDGKTATDQPIAVTGKANFTLWLELTVQEDPKLASFHVEVEYDIRRYREKPFLGLLQVKRQQESGAYELLYQAPEAPPLPRTFRSGMPNKPLAIIHGFLHRVLQIIAPFIGFKAGQRIEDMPAFVPVILLTVMVVIASLCFAVIITLLFNVWFYFTDPKEPAAEDKEGKEE